VLDVGAYDSFFSFEAERRTPPSLLAYDHLRPEHTGFATAKKLLNSNVEHRFGSVYDLSPAEVGEFDIVLFLGVNYHPRHPLLAVQRLRSVCRDEMYLESHVTQGGFEVDGKLHTSPEILQRLRAVRDCRVGFPHRVPLPEDQRSAAVLRPGSVALFQRRVYVAFRQSTFPRHRFHRFHPRHAALNQRLHRVQNRDV